MLYGRMYGMWLFLTILAVICFTIQIIGVSKHYRKSFVVKLFPLDATNIPVLKAKAQMKVAHLMPVDNLSLELQASSPGTITTASMTIPKYLSPEMPLYTENEQHAEPQGKNTLKEPISSQEKQNWTAATSDSTNSQGLQYGTSLTPVTRHAATNTLKAQRRMSNGLAVSASDPVKNNEVPETNINTPIADTPNDAPVKLPPSCQPKTHIMFLKTHKTASSTVLNILYRFGDAKNLSFALPRNSKFQLGYPKQFSAKQVEGFLDTGTQYDIMCNHLRFYSPEVEKVMPNDTFYFSIIRNPTTMVESSFTYYKDVAPAFSNAETLSEFAKYPWRYYEASRINNHYARNLLWFDFGFNNNANYSKNNVSYVINKIETTFDLILVTEYFDESMILFKEALCWELDDVVSFKLNLRSNDTKQSLSDETIENIKEWNILDWELYHHFNRTFWQKIDETIGREKMQQEVEVLRQKQAELMEACLDNDGAVDPSKVNDNTIKPFQFGSARILGYNLNPKLNSSNKVKCQHIITPELQYTTLLYNKQFLYKMQKQEQSAQNQAQVKREAPKPVDTSEPMGQNSTRKINWNKKSLKRTQTEKIVQSKETQEGLARTESQRSDTIQDKSRNIESPTKDQSPHIESPTKDQSPHIKSPTKDQSPHIESPTKDQSPHIESPTKDQSPHIESPNKDQSPHIKSPTKDQSPQIESPTKDQSPRMDS